MYNEYLYMEIGHEQILRFVFVSAFRFLLVSKVVAIEKLVPKFTISYRINVVKSIHKSWLAPIQGMLRIDQRRNLLTSFIQRVLFLPRYSHHFEYILLFLPSISHL